MKKHFGASFIMGIESRLVGSGEFRAGPNPAQWPQEHKGPLLLPPRKQKQQNKKTHTPTNRQASTQPNNKLQSFRTEPSRPWVSVSGPVFGFALEKPAARKGSSVSFTWPRSTSHGLGQTGRHPKWNPGKWLKHGRTRAKTCLAKTWGGSLLSWYPFWSRHNTKETRSHFLLFDKPPPESPFFWRGTLLLGLVNKRNQQVSSLILAKPNMAMNSTGNHLKRLAELHDVHQSVYYSHSHPYGCANGGLPFGFPRNQPFRRVPSKTLI